MKNTNEMISAIEETFKNASCDLTEIQSAVLAGCLFIWFDEIRRDEREASYETSTASTAKADKTSSADSTT